MQISLLEVLNNSCVKESRLHCFTQQLPDPPISELPQSHLRTLLPVQTFCAARNIFQEILASGQDEARPVQPRDAGPSQPQPGLGVRNEAGGGKHGRGGEAALRPAEREAQRPH